jgi:hypothetical protein
MSTARAVWLAVAVLALIGLVIVTRAPGGPRTSLATLQIGVVTHQARSAAEATAATQAMQTATVSALETQVAQLQEPNTPIASSPVPGTPRPGGTTSWEQLRPTSMDHWGRDRYLDNSKPAALSSRMGPLCCMPHPRKTTRQTRMMLIMSMAVTM